MGTTAHNLVSKEWVAEHIKQCKKEVQPTCHRICKAYLMCPYVEELIEANYGKYKKES